MGVDQHACPQVGVLGLGPIIIREYVPGGTFGVLPPWCHFAVVKDQEFELSPSLLVSIFFGVFFSTGIPLSSAVPRSAIERAPGLVSQGSCV